MRSPFPNLFLIGAMKSGTTYLGRLLGDHPAIYMSPEKEPCHFVDQKALRRIWPHRHAVWGKVDRYLELFAGAEDASIVGEASTPYSHVPLFEGVAERILDLSPNARFIYIMRDPVERTISHYWHRVRWWDERRDMLAAIRSDPQYTDVSNYARQLGAYLRHVPRDRIYSLTLEALIADPLRELRATYAWLGVDSSFTPPSLGVPLNERPAVVERVRGLGLLNRLKRLSPYEKIASFVPAPARRLGSRFASVTLRPDEVSVDHVERYLRPRQQLETRELSDLLGRAFPEWRTLHGTAQPA